MGKNSKKRKAERREIRQQWELEHKLQSGQVADIQSSTSLLPPTVATNPTIDDALLPYTNKENYKIIFANYNHNECQLHKLNERARAKGLIGLFNRITQANPSNLASTGIVRDNVCCTGVYSGLDSTVPPDVELKEADFSGVGRLYFYLIQNYFCVVAIQCQHKNI